MILPLVAALLLAQASGMPQQPPRNAPRHPEVGAFVDCESCHADATPAALDTWRASRHGLVGVRCVVCHGSTGADFTRVSGPARCTGCHAAQVESVAGRKLGAKGCFACHPGHALLPTAQGTKSPHVEHGGRR